MTRAGKSPVRGRSQAPLQARQSTLSEHHSENSLMTLWLRPRRPCAEGIGRTAGSPLRWERIDTTRQRFVLWSNTLSQCMPKTQQQRRPCHPSVIVDVDHEALWLALVNEAHALTVGPPSYPCVDGSETSLEVSRATSDSSDD